MQRLRNLLIFKHVTYSVNESDSGKIVKFICDELYTLLPILNYGGVSDNLWYQIGALDYNWMGRGFTFGGYYRYYDRHSIATYLKAPYLYNKKWGLALDLAKLSTIEPAYFNEESANYNVDRWNFFGFVIYNFSWHNRIELGGGYLYERYDKNEIRSEEFAPGPDLKEFQKILMKLVYNINFIDYYYQYLNGFYNDLNLENVSTHGEQDLFWKFLNISKFFLRTGQSGNFAFRLRLGISTNKDSPFVPFVLDNYINVRGSGNRTSRGTAEMTINSEYRYTLWEHSFAAIQGVIYMDMSAWRPAAGKFNQMFNDKNNVTFAGSGVRVYIKKFNNFTFRLDFGKSVTGSKKGGFVFGAGQYF